MGWAPSTCRRVKRPNNHRNNGSAPPCGLQRNRRTARPQTEDATVFALRTPITIANLVEIKTDLAKALPQVKSSHRVEAFARGIGFRTHAALLAAAQSQHQIFGNANGSVFVSYLADHRFDIEPIHFYRVAARVAMRTVLEQVPKLTASGIGAGHRNRNPDGTLETWSEYHARFLKWHAELTHDFAIEEFLRALAFVQRVQAVKTIRNCNSYGLKHMAENYICTYPEGAPLGPHYVSNGALIAAAVHAGFRYKTYVDDFGYVSLNVSFNMSKRSLDDLNHEIRQGRDRRRAA